MKLTRRQLLKWGLISSVGVALPIARLQAPLARIWEAEGVKSPSVQRFLMPLPTPPILTPTRTDTTTDYYEITQREGQMEMLPGLMTTVWGYNGIFPGPTIEARSGRTVVIRQKNELPVPVVTHLHGGVTPPDSDGFPTDYIFPAGWDENAHAGHGGSGHTTYGFRDYTYPNQQRGAMLWYHDHRMDFTGPQVYKGLAGLYIIRDEIEEALPLPRGEKEIPLVITDKTFKSDGSLFYPSIDPSLKGQPGVLGKFTDGMLADTILVNGAAWPVLEVANTRYRFRILNASNARFYELALNPRQPMIQIGSDGGLLTAPISHDTILISPAERFDVVIDFSQYPFGTEITLKNLLEEGQLADVMRFIVTREETDDSSIPAQLAPDDDDLNPADAVTERSFFFLAGALGGMSTINFRTFEPDRIDARPKLDSTEIWNFQADPRHPIHMHLVHFKVIARGNGKPGPYDAGWKDTIFLQGGDVKVIAKFAGYRGKYVFHCHNLEHEDMMMMANFEVV